MELIDKAAALAEIEKLYNEEIDTYTRNILDMLKSNIDTLEVKVDAGGYPYIDKTVELYDYDKDVPLAKEGDRVKVIVIKED